ncbi:pseudouridine synthase [Thiomicrorhabdus sp. Kp2]|uniref:pseudouridine synthase n=1 Tax=Thiomicrorhabdus sp. Kp2 TaxID=1123518 RepID=UPI00041E7F3B|nr:pseudouridine synthase [Thiomicrorhabdus sp. Kp2]
MIRINKWLSEMGVCSRKKADLWITEHRVKVNGKLANLGQKIFENDFVEVDGNAIKSKPSPIFLLYNKPVGVVCTHDLSVKNNIEHAINYPQRIFAVGRLDKDSEGLMLLTNQGDSVNKIMRAENKHQKVYKVWVDKPLTESFKNLMETGVAILDTVTLPCTVEILEEMCFQITLTQGLNLQIRRMCKALGYRVLRLQRIQIMDFYLADLSVGQLHQLSELQTQQLLVKLDGSVSYVH